MEKVKAQKVETVEVEKVKEQKGEKSKVSKIIGHLEHVGVENISTYLRQQGVIVQEHIGRPRIKFTLSPEALGIDSSSKTDEVKNFMKSHLDLGKLVFIPKHLDNQLQKIEQRVRYERKQLAIGYDDKYMSMESFEKFNEKIKKESEEYMLVRDNIVAVWDSIVENFKKDLTETLESLNALKKEELFRQIVSKIPKKENYAASFYMYASVKAFPVPENLEMFSPSMQEMMKNGIEEDTMTTLNQIVASTLNESIHSINLVLRGYKDNNLISKKATDSIKSASKKVKEKNILGHPLLTKIGEELFSIGIQPSQDDAFLAAENLSYLIYGFAKDLDIVNLIDLSGFVLSKKELEENYELFYEEI